MSIDSVGRGRFSHDCWRVERRNEAGEYCDVFFRRGGRWGKAVRQDLGACLWFRIVVDEKEKKESDIVEPSGSQIYTNHACVSGGGRGIPRTPQISGISAQSGKRFSSHVMDLPVLFSSIYRETIRSRLFLVFHTG